MSSRSLKAKLRHVRWIGGGSGAGKSTLARMLAEHYDLRLVETEPFSKYDPRLNPTNAPLLHEFMAMDMDQDQRWLDRTPQCMFETFHAVQGEGFNLIVDDLLALPNQRLVLVEGFRLLPQLVAPLLSHRSQAVWLLPTSELRLAAFETRGSKWDIAGKTSNPEKALANLLARDQLFTDELRRQADALGLPTIEVDIHMRIDDLASRVAGLIGLRQMGS